MKTIWNVCICLEWGTLQSADFLCTKHVCKKENLAFLRLEEDCEQSMTTQTHTLIFFKKLVTPMMSTQSHCIVRFYINWSHNINKLNLHTVYSYSYR
jgi:hypothetical protein